MIGFLRGRLVRKRAPHLLLDVQGVGYEVEAPMSTFYDLPETGAEVTLQTHLVVREDAHILFAFATESERRLFRSLIRVNGVGPRLALTILSGTSVDGFLRCVQDNDAAALTRLPGVGKKTAERLVVEMRDRLNDVTGGTDGDGLAGVALNPADEAATALVALGYKAQEAARMIRAVDAAGLTAEQIIRLALQQMVRG